MNKFLPTLVLGLLLAITAWEYQEAVAQSFPEARIAIVNFQLVQKNSTAMIDIQSQIEKRRLLYQKELTIQEQELRAANQALAQQQSVLTEEAFALKRREFEAKVAQVQRMTQDRKRELTQSFDYGLNQVQLLINDIIAELSEQKGFNLVLSGQQIVFAENSLNISEDVIRILNERLPLVEVP